MSETTVVNEVVAPAAEAVDTTVKETAPTPDESSSEGKFDADYVKSLRQEAAKYRTQAKEMAEKAKAYDEYVESQKSESQKMADALKAASEERDALKTEMLRLKVASAKNLPGPLADRLRGGTLEEMEADADALLAGLQSQFVAKQKPTPDQTGAGVVGEAKDISADEFLNILKSRS
jgi:hypothetical protein